MLLIIVIILLILALGGGGWGYSRGWGHTSMSPLLVIALIACVLYFTGHLRLH